MNKKTLSSLLKQKNHKKITMMTCYDYTFAKILNQTDMDILLVGDSLGNVVAGHETTVPVTLEDMIYHTRAVKRGADNPFILADMPFMSYQISVQEGLRNAGRLMKEGLADGVKLEGGEEIADLVYRLSKIGIPVVGHLGLQPQSVHQLGGFRVVGKKPEEAKKLLKDAKMLEEAGAFCVVLELVPSALAQQISQEINILTVGIGSGPHCDGQVLVFADALGLTPNNFKHNKKYLNLFQDCQNAFNQYIKEVEEGSFPALENCF